MDKVVISRALALAVPIFSGACDYGPPSDSANATASSDGGADAGRVFESTIDTGTKAPGVSGGTETALFVAYSSITDDPTSGLWTFVATCNTSASDAACDWDVTATPLDGAVTSFGPTPVPSTTVTWGSDYLRVENAGNSARLTFTTTTEVESLWLKVTRGATMRLNVLLNSEPAERYLYWVGDGGLHRGSPSDPLDLRPSSP